MTEQEFKGTIELSINSEWAKGEFLEAHDLEEEDFKDREIIKKALENEIMAWLECLNIFVDLEIK